jgi:TonB family protein
MASDWEQGIPACVEATAILPDDRKVVTQIHVGSFKQFSLTTRFHFAVIENESQFQSVRRLSDLPQILREPFVVRRQNEGKRLNVITLPQLRLAGPSQYSYARSSTPLSQPEILPVGTEDDSPPPKPPPPIRVSRGVTAGEALTKVWPLYPSIAKQINASGDVLVAITIDESGKVIEARATNGHPVLRSAAEDAARKWVFKPTLLDGKPVKQPGVLTFKFVPPK